MVSYRSLHKNREASFFHSMFEYGGVKVILKKIYAQNTCIHTLTERNSL